MELKRATLVVLGFVSFAASARQVSISLDSSATSLVLTNPSTVSVTYNLTCYKSDGSATTTALTGQTLAPNARVSHTTSIPDSGLCAASAAPDYTGTDTSSNPFYYCSGSNNYANAAGACGTGNSFCFPTVSFAPFMCGSSSYWLKNDGGVQYKPSCGSYANLGGSNQAVTGGASNGFSGSARKSASAGACAFFNYANEVSDSATYGSVCCASPVLSSVCKIDITTTNPSAFLSSPSFMGGAAF